jgi:hypothetical protein
VPEDDEVHRLAEIARHAIEAEVVTAAVVEERYPLLAPPIRIGEIAADHAIQDRLCLDDVFEHGEHAVVLEALEMHRALAIAPLAEQAKRLGRLHA